MQLSSLIALVWHHHASTSLCLQKVGPDPYSNSLREQGEDNGAEAKVVISMILQSYTTNANQICDAQYVYAFEQQRIVCETNTKYVHNSQLACTPQYLGRSFIFLGWGLLSVPPPPPPPPKKKTTVNNMYNEYEINMK